MVPNKAYQNPQINASNHVLWFIRVKKSAKAVACVDE